MNLWGNKYTATLLLLIFEFVFLGLVVPTSAIEKSMNTEKEDIKLFLGQESADFVYTFAQDMYESSIVNSGLYESVYTFLIPTEEQKQASKGMEELGTREGVFDWTISRLDALCYTIYQFYVRVGTCLIWLPYVLILLIPAFICGVLERKVKQSNFAYSSPIVTQYATRFFIWLGLATVMLVFVPIPFPPEIIPIILMVVCVLIGQSIGNIQKRL